MLRLRLPQDGDCWWGRVGGLIGGFMLARWWGAALGFVLGYLLCDLILNHRLNFKNLISRFRRSLRRSPEGGRLLEASFALMGYAAVGCGPQAFERCRYLIELMLLSQSQRDQALQAFREGQDRDFAPDGSLSFLNAGCDLSSRAVIVSLIIEVTCAAGPLSAPLRCRIGQIGERLGISASDVARMIERHSRTLPALPRR